jgi:hypothetical protein
VIIGVGCGVGVAVGIGAGDVGVSVGEAVIGVSVGAWQLTRLRTVSETRIVANLGRCGNVGAFMVDEIIAYSAGASHLSTSQRHGMIALTRRRFGSRRSPVASLLDLSMGNVEVHDWNRD